MPRIANEEIGAERIRLIGTKGERLGTMTVGEALQEIDRASHDIVLVNATASPPFAKIRPKEGRVAPRTMQERPPSGPKTVPRLKEIHVGTSIGPTDFVRVLEKIKGFLTASRETRVKVVVEPRGVQAKHPGGRQTIFGKINDDLVGKGLASLIEPPQAWGRDLIFVLGRPVLEKRQQDAVHGIASKPL